MDRKTVLALIIIGIIFVGWIYLTAPKPQDQVATQPIAADTTGTESVAASDSENIGYDSDTLSGQAFEQISSDSLWARFDSLQVDTVTVETDKFIARFCGRGASLISLKFKQYFYHNGDTSMVEMVPPWAGSALRFEFPDAGGNGFDMDRVVFAPSKTGIKISGGSSDKLIFHARLNDRDYIEIEYDFYGDRYDFGVRFNFEGANAHDLGDYYLYGWKNGLESTEKDRQDDFNSYKAYILWDNGLDKYNKFDHGQMSFDLEGTARWIATMSKYFFVGIAPERDPDGVIIQGREVKVNPKANEPGMRKIGIQARMQIHQRKAELFDKYLVYIGPIDYEIMKSYGNGFEQTVDLGGILKPISLFIIWLMRGLYSFLGNYGLVIIVFSILMKLVFYPLTSRSLRSMKKMQEIQPRMKAIQEKYKSEPQKSQAEIMKLFKENKVNPMSGCLLMLPQLPIFYALFSVFRNTILLRGAPFAFWMKDLSQPDHTMILPIIMALTMFLQQKMTMQDPKQKMLVYILPLVFLFLFKGFSTGLVLYWTMFNILSVVETMLIRKPQQASQVTVQN